MKALRQTAASLRSSPAKINLHFHGDFHAITSAHNLLAALVDVHVFHGNELDLDINDE